LAAKFRFIGRPKDPQPTFFISLIPMSLLDQIEQNPLLLDSEEVRAQVRDFPELDYNKAWDLYLLSKAHQTTAAKVLKTGPPKPLFLLPGLVVLNVLQWWQVMTCLVYAAWTQDKEATRRVLRGIFAERDEADDYLAEHHGGSWIASLSWWKLPWK
jgi:hypothetical protein